MNSGGYARIEPVGQIVAEFINNRFITLAHKGKCSRKTRTKAGVAQGTITTPRTFKIAVDPVIRLLRRIACLKIKSFADDFILYVTGNCPANIELCIGLCYENSSRLVQNEFIQDQPVEDSLFL